MEYANPNLELLFENVRIAFYKLRFNWAPIDIYNAVWQASR